MFAENVRSGNVPSSWIIFKVKIDRKSNTEDKCELFQRCVELYGYSRCQLRHPFFLFQVSFMRIFLHFFDLLRVSKYFISVSWSKFLESKERSFFFQCQFNKIFILYCR